MPQCTTIYKMIIIDIVTYLCEYTFRLTFLLDLIMFLQHSATLTAIVMYAGTSSLQPVVRQFTQQCTASKQRSDTLNSIALWNTSLRPSVIDGLHGHLLITYLLELYQASLCSLHLVVYEKGYPDKVEKELSIKAALPILNLPDAMQRVDNNFMLAVSKAYPDKAYFFLHKELEKLLRSVNSLP